MTLAKDIILSAFARDAAVDVNLVATQQAEVISQVGRVLRKALAFGMRECPAYFGTIKNVALSSVGGITGWARPSDAYAIYRVEAAGDTKDEAANVIASGAKIEVVGFEERTFLAGQPSLYEFGRFFIRAGNAGDPSTGSITFLYAAKPVVPVALADVIDDRWPDDLNDLLICEMNAWFCQRDGRDPKGFQDTANEWYAIFAQWLKDSTLNVAQRNVSFVPSSASARAED